MCAGRATASGSPGAPPNAAPPACARSAGSVRPSPGAASADPAPRRPVPPAVRGTRGCAPPASRGGTWRRLARTSGSGPAGRQPSAPRGASASSAERIPPNQAAACAMEWTPPFPRRHDAPRPTFCVSGYKESVHGHIWSAPHLPGARLILAMVKNGSVADIYPASYWEANIGSRALMESAHTNLNNATVSKTFVHDRLPACRSDLSCHHSMLTPCNCWRCSPPEENLYWRRINVRYIYGPPRTCQERD